MESELHSYAPIYGMGILLIVLLLVITGIRWYRQYYSVLESFQTMQSPYQIQKHPFHHRYEVTFDDTRGEREIAFFDYLFYLNQSKDLPCQPLRAMLMEPTPHPDEIWNFRREGKLYVIVTPMESFDWILIKSILEKICNQTMVTHAYWMKIKPLIRKQLESRQMIFSEKRQKNDSFNKEWRTLDNGQFHPLANEPDIDLVNIYNQDLKNINDSLLDINFDDPKIYTEKETIKSYVDQDVKPMGWLNEKDLKIQYERDTDNFDLQHLPLNAYQSRPWNIRSEMYFTSH